MESLLSACEHLVIFISISIQSFISLILQFQSIQYGGFIIWIDSSTNTAVLSWNLNSKKCGVAYLTIDTTALHVELKL